MTIRSTSKLRCEFEKTSPELFFSLVDYRNKLLTSNNPEKIIEFYNGFENRDQLIQWMKKRPKGVSYIYEVEGDKDIIVVIPTANINGKYGVNCREDIFKGLHMIFVESGGIGDFYFNIAHNINVGIKKALEYNPKWIVFSSDDMFKIDDTTVLINELKSLNNQKCTVVYTKPSSYHSIPCKLGRSLWTRRILYKLLGKWKSNQIRLEQKFGVNYFLAPIGGYWRFFFGHGVRIISIADFGIFSANFFEDNSGFYDEIYINSSEDMDISLRVFMANECRTNTICYRIGDYKGSTLGNGTDRRLMEIAGLAYFNHKVENEYLTSLNKQVGK